MPYNGNGIFSRIYSWVTDKNNNIDITASRMDTDTNDIVNNGLSLAFVRDGQAAATGNWNLGNFRITLLGSASALTDAARTDQVQQESYTWCGVATGTANALTLTPAPAITSYATGARFRFISSSSPNTTATTVAVSGLATKAAQYLGSALVANDILASKIYEVVYDGTALQLNKSFAAAPAGVSITAADATIVVSPTPITGTGTVAAGVMQSANIAASAVTNAKLANMNNNTVKGNVSGGAAAPVDLTATQLTTLVNAVTSSLSGAAPASGGGTTNFLRADATWAAPPSVKIAQVVTTQVGTSTTGTTTLPFDDTIPQITEGDQYMSLAITPTNASSTLIVAVVTNSSNSAGVSNFVSTALFRDSTANALGAAGAQDEVANQPHCTTFTVITSAASTSATTFKVRCGSDNPGTTTFNGRAGGRIFGGVMASSITITEVLP